MTKPSDDTQIEFAWNVHQYLNEYIRFGDQKAGAVLAWVSALLGICLTLGIPDFFTKVGFTLIDIQAKATVLGVLSLLAVTFLCSAFLLAAKSILPNLHSTQGKGMIFWENIRRYEKADYRDGYSALSSEQLLVQVTEHISDLSRVCHSKYFLLALSLYCALFGSVCTVLVIFFDAWWN